MTTSAWRIYVAIRVTRRWGVDAPWGIISSIIRPDAPGLLHVEIRAHLMGEGLYHH